MERIYEYIDKYSFPIYYSLFNNIDKPLRIDYYHNYCNWAVR